MQKIKVNYAFVIITLLVLYVNSTAKILMNTQKYDKLVTLVQSTLLTSILHGVVMEKFLWVTPQGTTPSDTNPSDATEHTHRLYYRPLYICTCTLHIMSRCARFEPRLYRIKLKCRFKTMFS